MGIRLIIVGWLSMLLLALAPQVARAEPLPLSGFAVQDSLGQGNPNDDGIFKWEQDLRSFAFHFLKDLRRWSIRLSRYIQRSAGYWATWFAGSFALLLFGGVVSAVDRRILMIGWRQGMRVAMGYAWVGLIVFLRLLRDPRVPGRLRLIIPAALVYGIASHTWIDTGQAWLDAVDELLVMGLASRWFVRRCPDAVLNRHASYARERVEAVMPTSSEPGS